MEEYRAVVGFEGWYEVSNLGNVCRIPAQKYRLGDLRLTGGVTDNGYHRISVRKKRGERLKLLLVHRLVAEAFLGTPPTPKHQVNHKNGNKLDNRVENLEWVTASENQCHSYMVLGRVPQAGERSPAAKLTEADVLSIRAQWKSGIRQKIIAAQFGIAANTVSGIVNRLYWKHLPSQTE